MKWLTAFGLALQTALAAAAIASQTASAEGTPLPVIRTALPGEAYPLNLGGHLKGVSKFKTSGGGTIPEGTEYSILLSIKEPTSLGEATIDFLGLVKAGTTEKCHTEGDSEANGAVLIPNADYHLVYTGLSPNEKLELAALVLFTTFVISCDVGAFEVEEKGPSTARVNVPRTEAGDEGDSADIETATHCATPASSGLQEISYYYNDALERVATTLLANVSGVGFLNGCEEIEGTVLLTPETGSLATMFSVLF